MAVPTGGATVEISMEQFENGLVARGADLDQQEGGYVDITDRKQHPLTEPDIEMQIASGFKERNMKKLRDLLLPTSKKICRNCNSCTRLSQWTVDWKKVVNSLRRSRGVDRRNILNTFKILVRDLPGQYSV
jgi:hypothetical protein